MARDVGDADAELQLGAELIADRRLDIDRADIGVIAQEPAGEGIRVPFGLEAVWSVQPDAGSQLRIDGVGNVDVGDGDQRVLEIAFAGQEVVGEVALCTDQRDPDADMRAGESRESGRTKVDSRAVRAGPCGGNAAAAHRARIVLVYAKSLPGKRVERGGDKQSSSSEQHQRKPPHTSSPTARIG